MNAFAIPPEDQPLLNRLPQKVRDEVNQWVPAMAALLELGGKGVCQAFRSAAGELRVSPATVRGLYYAVREQYTLWEMGQSELHPWRVLINEAKCGRHNQAVPSEFISDCWHGLVVGNQRNTKKAHEALCAMWAKGEPIPGYPVEGRTPKLPAGLSYRNLVRRKYMPSEAGVIFARRGIAAARVHLPSVLQDVSQVRPLEYLLFDDVELDFLIIVPESQTPVKLRLIVAMDLCTRMILGYGVRPGLIRPDGIEDSLKLRDMKAVCARILAKWGVPVDYTMTWVVERGTAAVPLETEAALKELSGGQIVISRTSMVVGQVFDFRDRATGNSFGKAWLESFFNPMHGQLAAIEGQKGRRYDLAPAELEGRRKELATLVRAGRRLPLELRYQFRWPFKTMEEALRELDAGLNALHTATNRTLQGFDQIGLWRLNDNDGWKDEAELAQWPELIGRVQMTTRQETPMERWNRKIGEVARREIPDCSLHRLMDDHAEVRFQDYQFSFTFKGADYTYLPPDAMLPLLEHGAKYVLWFHPQDMSTVYVTRSAPHLGYVGKLTQFQRVRRGDMEGAKEAIKEKMRLFNHALRGVQAVKIDRLRQRAEDIAANTEVLRNAQAMETEIDFAPGSEPPVSASAPDSIRAITEDLRDRAAAAAEAQATERETERRISAEPKTMADLISGNAPEVPGDDFEAPSIGKFL